MQVSTFKAMLALLQPGQKIRVSGCMYDTRVLPIAVVGTDLITSGTVEAPTGLIAIDGIMRCGVSPHFAEAEPANDHEANDAADAAAEAEAQEIEGGQE